MDNSVYNWRVAEGNLTIQRKGDSISLKIDGEGNDHCLLTRTDTTEIVELLTQIAQDIWQSPGYVAKPYNGQIFTLNKGEYTWHVDETILKIRYNDAENRIEIQSQRNCEFNLEINIVVEIIQVLEGLNQ